MSEQYRVKRIKRITRSILLAVASGAAVVGLAACGGVSGQVASTQPTGTNALPSPAATSSTPTTPASATATASATPTDDPSADNSTVKFGGTYTWENGLSATISAPKPYRPTDTAAGTEGFKHFVQFTVTIVNKTGTAFDPEATNHSVQSGDVEGSQVFEASPSMDTPSTKILNGRQVRYKVAFGVTNPKDVVFEFTPSYEYDSAIWTK